MASDSKARKKLLDVCGIRFRVLPSRAKEESSGRNYPALVKKNALRKAQDVAMRIKSGVVVSADTIVVQGKKIFGKPHDLKEAKAMLKKFSRSPQKVYTGIAVIDKDKAKVKVSYEKTKIYLDALSAKEIDAYFKHTSPLDKAGSFDIQGRGAFFIRRIEGCFYNVVGLPLRKLYRMFKELKINFFMFLLVTWCLGALVTFLSGCSTEYNVVTGQEETFYYSTDREVQIGQSIAKQIAKEYKFAEDPLIQKRVEDIAKKLVAVCDRKDIDYSFKVIQDEEVNAFALPGGFIYVNSGLVDKVESDDELAGVLGHEIGHIVARHSIKKLQAIMGYSILRMLTVPIPQSGEIGSAADIAFTEIMLGYGRDDELLADQLGTRYTKSSGYNPRAMITFLERLQDINRRKPPRPKSYFKTHPYVPDRIRIVKQELGEKMGFTDYINIEEVEGQ